MRCDSFIIDMIYAILAEVTSYNISFRQRIYLRSNCVLCSGVGNIGEFSNGSITSLKMLHDFVSQKSMCREEMNSNNFSNPNYTTDSIMSWSQ